MCIISMWYTRVSVCPIRFLCFGWGSIPFLRAIHSTFSDISYLSERQRADEEKSRCVFTYHLGCCCFCFCLLLLRSSFSSFAIPSYWIIFSSMTSAGLWSKKASSIFKSPPSNSRLESESWIRMILLPLNSTFTLLAKIVFLNFCAKSKLKSTLILPFLARKSKWNIFVHLCKYRFQEINVSKSILLWKCLLKILLIDLKVSTSLERLGKA